MSLSPGSRSAFGSLSPKQYTDFVTRELFHFLISKKVSNGYTKDLTKEFLTTYLTNSLNNTTKPSLGENDNISVGQQYEPGSDQPTNHTDNTGQTSGPGAMKISKKHRKNPLIAFTTEEEIEQAISNTTKNNLSSIVDELTELIHSSQADIQSFISGMREYRTIDDARQAIKHYDSMISERRISIMLRGGGPTTADSEYIKYCGGEIKNIEILIQKKLQFQETSAVTNYYRRRDIAHRTRRDEFIIFEERETKINKAIDHLTRGEHCLIEGPTGTGKTVIAKEIAARVEKRLGKTAYIADGPTISKINSPEKFNEIMNKIVRLYSGHSRSNAQDLAVKLGMEGDIEIVEQLVGMLRAIHEGVPFIIDEIDLIPTETLMSIKALFTLKPGQWTIPDSGTGTIAYHIPRKPMLIATMNGASDKHKRNKLDPAMLRLFDHQDTLGYLDTEKTYDYLVGQLFNEHDYIDGVALNEIKDTANGIIPNLCKFIDMVNQSYQGKKPIPMPALVTGVSSLQQGFLKDKVIEMQKLTTILSGFRIQSTENSLTQYVKSEILSRCLGHANPEDTALLLRAAVIHGLIDYNPTSDHNDIKQSSLILGKTIIDHKHGWTEKTLTDLFADHSNNPRVVRNQSDNLLINAYQIGLQDYVTDPTNPQATSNKPKLEIGYHKETIEQLELIKQQLGTIAATDSINTISTWIKTITQPDNLTKPRTDSIGEDKRKGLIDSVFNTMKKKYKIKENTTDNTKKDDTKKEHDIWNVIKSLDGLTGYVEDIFKDERYKESPPPPPPLDHTPSGFSYQIKEYPLDTTTEQGKRILGIRNNFLDGIKRKDAQGNFVVDQPRNQKIIDIGNKLINQGLFKIHQTSYNGHTIPVFSFRRSPTEPRISFTTTQHMISLDQATERNNDPANNDKPKLDTTDFTHRTPGNNIDYKVTTMNYNDIKNRSSQGIGSLPYGDHLQNMATGLGTEGGVTIEVEHKPDGYFRTMILPVLSAISGYAIPTQGISSDLLGVLNYLTGGTGRFYCDNTNSYVLLKVDDRCLNQFGLDDCALCAKVTWPTSPEGEGKLDYGLITQDLLRKKYQEKNLPLPPAYIYINGTYIDENGQEVPKSIVAKQPISFIAMTITNQDTKQSDFHERVFVRNKETIKKLYKMFGVNYKSFKEGQTKEATTYIKDTIFQKYQHDRKFEKAFKIKDWFRSNMKDSDEMTLRTLIKQYQQDCNMGGVFPGFQSADGIHLGAGDALYVWLPVSVGGFPVFLGSSSDKSNLDHGSASDAHPVLLPTPRGKLAHETKVKPQEFVTFENAWMDKVKNLPNQASFGQMNLAGTTIPVFHKTLNNFAGVNKTDDEVKKDYETAIKTELKHRIDLWMKQYVSYLPNYKGTQSHGIMIRNSSINTKLNNGKPIVIYVLNNKDYIESKIKNLGGLNSSSASLYNDFITGDQKVAFYRRNFTDKDNKTLDITQPSTWLDSHMYGAANRTDHNLLKPIIQDISQDGCFQGFPDRDDRVSIISKDCGIPYTQYILGSNDKSVFGLIMIQYFINELYWFWSKQTKGSNSSSYVYLNDVGRWLSQSGNVYCALCAMDYLAHP